ncbi:MAG TPA: hypothetical protein VE870_08490, partial [Bacteroidales bacterium]|nr:hypothetical protein [Bacteroidales bacterium]
DANTGITKTTEIHNLIEDLTGEIRIDEPSNKSGLKDYPQYPVFSSREDSYVYFDSPSIQNGVYHRNRVFFEIYSFNVDSLDNFSRAGMKLKGMFESGGMLPPIEQTLTLQADNSLGFFYSTPENGIPVYNGKGTFYHDVEMSSNGLHGSGKLEYLSSTTFSDDFLMHPDSLMALGREFSIREQVQGTSFPEVSSKNDKIRWLPQKDRFYAYRQDVPFTMYNDTTLLRGDLLIEPSGLSGKGTVDMVSARVKSDNFRFVAKNILADSSAFMLNSLVSDAIAISADNVKSNVNLADNTGEFYSNKDYTLVSFPEVRYVSNLDFFKWDIKAEKIEMGLNKPVKAGLSGVTDSLSGPRYISVKPSQDSLNFVAPLAIYDYRQSLLNAKNVPYIRVADARIYPDNGDVVIRKNAQMQTLAKAGIVADIEHQYYSLYGASVTINSSKDYSASAYYDYLDLSGVPQEILFKRISVDSTLQTTGSGELSLLDTFRLSPFFEYQGKVRLEAREPELFFDGATRLVHDCSPGKGWLKFKASINPDSVMIPVSEAPLDINLNPVYFGNFITRDSAHIYTAFASGRRDFFDALVTTADGFLRYDRFAERYEVAPLEKLADKTAPGNIFALDRVACKTYSEGQINYQVNYGQLNMTSVGQASQDLKTDTFSTKAVIALDFYFSPEALSEFGRELDSLPSLAPYDLTDPFYRQSLTELVGTEAAKRMEADMSLYGEYRTIPNAFKKT